MTAAATQGWIGVDLDGTLAHYDHFVSPDHIGDPVPAMVERVRGWLAEGKDVRIFTARVAQDGTEAGWKRATVAGHAIARWCQKHIGAVLPVTAVKDFGMIECWDDRAVQVGKNSGADIRELLRITLRQIADEIECYCADNVASGGLCGRCLALEVLNLAEIRP